MSDRQTRNLRGIDETSLFHIRCGGLVLGLAAAVSGCRGRSEPAAQPTTPAIEAPRHRQPTESRSGADHRGIADAADAPTRILDPRADEVLRATADAAGQRPRAFAFEAEERFDDIPSGQPRTLLTNVRRVAVQRPSRFAADAEGDTLSRSVWFDGQNVSVYDRAQNVWASIPAPGSIDTALDTLSDKYDVSVPLADLLYSDPYAVLTEDVTYSKYLGLHLAARRALPPSRVLRNRPSSGRSGSMPASSRSFDNWRSPTCASRASLSTWPS